MWGKRSTVVLTSIFLAAALNLSNAQAPTSSLGQANAQANNPASPQSGYTLQANARIVLTDVTVTDAKGNPVRGLRQSAFRILDNKLPQHIASFEEHSGAVTPAALPREKRGVYSNDFLEHLPSVLNVIVIDIIYLGITDQMYLYHEMTKFLGNVPNGQPVAIYLRAGEHTFLVQNFTSDRTLLLDALRRAIPRFPPPEGAYLTGLDTMRQIASYLSQLPGRKNVIWFSGGSTHFLWPDELALHDDAAWRQLYDELNQERIAVYPVDGRGLTVAIIAGMAAQQGEMEELALATGGHAYYNTNGLTEAATQVLNDGGSFYTLTYSPSDFCYDNKWHAVRVTVEGGYHLSYRRGYFADGSMAPVERLTKPRTRLALNGDKIEISPQLRSVPIIFRAHVLPTSDPAVAARPTASVTIPPPPPQKGKIPYSIRYLLPLDAFTQKDVDGAKTIVIGVAVMAFNRNGSTVVKNGDRVSLALNRDSLRESPNAPIGIEQQVYLQKGDEYLYLAVWDMATGRLGTLQIMLDVTKPSNNPPTAAGESNGGPSH
jgi:VWFA-related protein